MTIRPTCPHGMYLGTHCWRCSDFEAQPGPPRISVEQHKELNAQLTATRKERDEWQDAAAALQIRFNEADARSIKAEHECDELAAQLAVTWHRAGALDLPDNRAVRLLAVSRDACALIDNRERADWCEYLNRLDSSVRAYREPDAGEKSEASEKRGGDG